MKLTLFTAVAALSASALAACNANNCLRAVRATASASARAADCKVYQAFSARPGYATACPDLAAYASACSCVSATATSIPAAATPTAPADSAPFYLVVAYDGKKVAASLQNDADRDENYLYNPDGGPYDQPYNPYQVLAANPGNVASLFTLDRTQLASYDKTQAAVLNQFYFDDYASEGDGQTYFYFIPQSRNNFDFDADPIQCDIGTYDKTVPGYPLNCRSLAAAFHIEAIVLSNGQPVLSTVPARAELGQVGAQLYAVAV